MPFLPAPSAPPTNISATDVTFFSITVQWGPLECIHHNGNITGYSVRYGVRGSKSTETVSISGGTRTETTISELDIDSDYSIEVAAVSNAGIGVYSVPIISTTSGKDSWHCSIKFVKYQLKMSRNTFYILYLLVMQGLGCANSYTLHACTQTVLHRNVIFIINKY